MSSVSLTAVAVLETPRHPAGKPKSLIFDAQLFIGTESALVAGLRYFNGADYTFAAVNICLIVANVVKYHKEAYNDLQSELEDNVYDLVGDIVYLIPLPTETDPRYVPFVHMSGTAVESRPSEFDVDISQRVQALPSAGVFPVMGYFPDSNRYPSGKKPVPKVNTMIAFSGQLTGTRGREREEKAPPARFVVTVENIAFLGRALVPPKSSGNGGPNTPGPKKPSPKLKFDFNSMSESSSPLAKKRKLDGLDSDLSRQ